LNETQWRVGRKYADGRIDWWDRVNFTTEEEAREEIGYQDSAGIKCRAYVARGNPGGVYRASSIECYTDTEHIMQKREIIVSPWEYVVLSDADRVLAMGETDVRFEEYLNENN